MIQCVVVSKIPRPRLMLVDDNAEFLEVMQLLLEPGCEVVAVVTDERRALEAATRLQPDLVLLDISMPHLSGVEVCRQIRSALPETRVIMVTAYGDEETKDMVSSAGALRVVSKYRVNDILEAVHISTATRPS